MLTHRWHLIPSLVFPGVCVSLIFNVDYSMSELDTDFDCGFFRLPDYIGILILTADFSVYLIRRTDFDRRLFRLPNLDTLILTTDFYV
jgi:hypothetical protein